MVFDARPLEGNSRFRGVGTYARGLLEHLPAAVRAQDLELMLVVESGEGLPDSCAALPRLQARRTLPGRLSGYEDAVVLGARLRRARADLFHSVEYSLPLGHPCPTVLTMHDLVPWILRAPYRRQRLRWMLQLKLAARADRLLCVSEATRGDVLRLLGVVRDRTVVIGEAVDHRVFRPPTPEQVAAARRLAGVGGPYYLYVGEFDQRKNPGLAMAAVKALRESGSRAQLVMVGRDAPYRHQLEQELGVHGEGVVVTGHLPSRDLVGLYGGAEALLFPSDYEGFGLPVLEAMACGCPVVARNVSSIPEVAGEAGLLVDGGPDQFVAAVGALAPDAPRREDMVAAGLARAAAFRWERVAEQVAALYAEVLS